jgi:L-rhamnose isomerase
MVKTKKIQQSASDKAAKKYSIPVSHDELHQAVDSILETPPLAKAFGDCLLLTFWTVKVGNRARQIDFARAMSRFLDTWTQLGRTE